MRMYCQNWNVASYCLMVLRLQFVFYVIVEQKHYVNKKKLHRQFQHYSSGLFRRFSNQFNDSVTNMYYQHGKQNCVNSKSLLLYHLWEKETPKEQTEADNLDDSRRMGQFVGRE